MSIGSILIAQFTWSGYAILGRGAWKAKLTALSYGRIYGYMARAVTTHNCPRIATLLARRRSHGISCWTLAVIGKNPGKGSVATRDPLCPSKFAGTRQRHFR